MRPALKLRLYPWTLAALCCAACAACGGGALTDGGALADGGVLDSAADTGGVDAGVFNPGDASWPASPCGQPVRRYTVHLTPDDAPIGLDIVSFWGSHGDDQQLVTAYYIRRTNTLWMQSVDLADGSISEARAELPDTGEVEWNPWVAASWARPVALVAAVAPITFTHIRRLLWVEANEGVLVVTELDVPAELPWNDYPAFEPTAAGFVGLDDSGAGPTYLVRVTRDGIVASPIELPPGSSYYGIAGQVDSPYAVITASGFTTSPHVELARVGPSGSPSPDAWREIFEGQDVALHIDLTPRRVALTASRDREVEVVWLDSSLNETARQRLTLPYPGVALALGEERHMLVAWGYDWGLAYGLLEDTSVASWRTLRTDDPPTPSLMAWSAGSAYAIVAPSGGLTSDAFLLCQEGP